MNIYNWADDLFADAYYAFCGRNFEFRKYAFLDGQEFHVSGRNDFGDMLVRFPPRGVISAPYTLFCEWVLSCGKFFND